MELLHVRKSGEQFWNLLSITPVRDAAGRLTSIIGVHSDITDLIHRRQAERELRVGGVQGSGWVGFRDIHTFKQNWGAQRHHGPHLPPPAEGELRVGGWAGRVGWGGAKKTLCERQLCADARTFVSKKGDWVGGWLGFG